MQGKHTSLFFFIAIIVFFILPAYTELCKNSDDEFLVTFHPHLDAFWLNIDTELKDINFRPAGFLYDMNQRNSKTIFNSMLTSLSSSKDRKYFVTESVFFKDWYDYIAVDTKAKVKQLLMSEQLEIANGGWVENDEAVCYYDDIIDQYTLGQNFLYQEFGYQVKIGWATDSFGHSHSQAALLHLLGVQFQGIERIDDRYINQHNGGPLLQFYWQPVSDSNNKSYGGLLNHVRHFLHEVNDLREVDDRSIQADFETLMQEMKKVYHKNKLFRFLGNDFEEFIPSQFTKLQRVMNDLNQKYGKQVCPAFKYGNPSDYLNMITKYYQKSALPTRKYDLMPNWDQDRYWTGYYTTDPLLKKVCKDYSRLVNFYRKSLLSTNSYKTHGNNLKDAEELLAVMQHHDGITATSKIYIQEEFRNRMREQSDKIISKLEQIHNTAGTFTCKFYQDNNRCLIPSTFVDGILKQLHIITHGTSKSQKIQLVLPINTFYDINEVEQDIFCQQTQDVCTLIFQAMIHPGVNTFTLTKKNKEQISSQISEVKSMSSLMHNGRDYTISIDNAKNNVKYEFGDGEYFEIGIYFSPNNGYVRSTTWWNKYGRSVAKNQQIVAGMYIMGNNGQISPVATPLTDISIAQGKIYKRIQAKSAVSKIVVTIKNDEPNIIDVEHKFKPGDRNSVDYFMKVSSSVKSDTLYHDSNGFLVSKREIDQRPDYEFKSIPGDRINANTYPVCSFAYLIDNGKKFLFFTDRAQGVASYNKDLLINFDRLAMDDGKGVGQGYFQTVTNIFRYKFAILSAGDDTERVWQRQYDQALIGYLSPNEMNSIKYRIIPEQQISHAPGFGPKTNLKYSIFYLNENQFVLRLQNMAEFSNLIVTKYTGSQGNYQWNIQEIGLKLKFADIKESYANGITLQNSTQWRKYWQKNKENSINILNHGKLDGDMLNVRPLQIRSFRINLNSKIVTKQLLRYINNNPLLQALHNTSPLKNLRKRCF